MGKSTKQKLKILYLMRILLEKTDETHQIDMNTILESLRAYDIEAERKSVYSDISLLRDYGLDIIGEKRNNNYLYHIGSRDFELAELKLLVDSVQSAKFITEKKSNELIKKLEGLASKYEANKLQRQVFVAERVKTMNESIYYNIDRIHEAIGSNRKIKFQYFRWTETMEQELRRNGDFYVVSPWALSCDDANYYLIAYDGEEQKIKHFRVDKMLHIDSLCEPREGRDGFKNFNMAVYAKKLFGMFDGEEQNVKLLCDNSNAGIIIDRFGKDIALLPYDDSHFTVTVRVALSGQFLGWIFGLGEGIKIIGPEKAKRRAMEEVVRLNRQYMQPEENSTIIITS